MLGVQKCLRIKYCRGIFFTERSCTDTPAEKDYIKSSSNYPQIRATCDLVCICSNVTAAEMNCTEAGESASRMKGCATDVTNCASMQHDETL